MALTREKFIKIINSLSNAWHVGDEVTELFRKYHFDVDFIDIFGLTTVNSDTIVELLGMIFKKPDAEDVLYWWMYDCNWGEDAVVYIDGKPLELLNAGDLYDYLMTYEG